jgi:hypothetical protein
MAAKQWASMDGREKAGPQTWSSKGMVWIGGFSLGRSWACWLRYINGTMVLTGYKLGGIELLNSQTYR